MSKSTSVRKIIKNYLVAKKLVDMYDKGYKTINDKETQQTVDDLRLIYG